MTSKREPSDSGCHSTKCTITPDVGVLVVVYTNSISVCTEPVFCTTANGMCTAGAVAATGSITFAAAELSAVSATDTKLLRVSIEPAGKLDSVVPVASDIATWAVWSFVRQCAAVTLEPSTVVTTA